MKTIGETLVDQLIQRSVTHVFGIPGVHTVEMYRGLASSNIRHVTPRHEQGAGFMADGYARSTGQIGVAFVITGPGLTNTLTAMAQARSDSVPMLVITSVNRSETLGKGLGHLHELPDQQATAATVALASHHVATADQLIPALDAAFDMLANMRGGPVHIEIPKDVLSHPFNPAPTGSVQSASSDKPDITSAADLLTQAKRPVILVGGGAKFSDIPLTKLADHLDAPVIQTVNARGLMHAHPLTVPASASLPSARALIADADVVLALGTELGPTDYDMYQDGKFPELANLIRVDICAKQLARHPAEITIHAPVETVLPSLLHQLGPAADRAGADRAADTRRGAFADLDDDMREQITFLNLVRDMIPDAIVVGDSTQPIYAGNLYYDHDRPAGWFNASTGFGALGFAIPAAVGASIANADTSVVCIAGDGGAQFSIAELMTATDEALPILFVIWNNNGFGEIDSSMRAVGIEPVGCDPTAPLFKHVAAAARIPFQSITKNVDAFAEALNMIDLAQGPAMIEIKL